MIENTRLPHLKLIYQIHAPYLKKKPAPLEYLLGFLLKLCSSVQRNVRFIGSKEYQ